MAEDSPTPPAAAAPPAPSMADALDTVLDTWGALLAPVAAVGADRLDPADKRFADPAWNHPVFALLRQGYQAMGDAVAAAVEAAPGDAAQKERMRFAARTLVEAMSPANLPWTNPLALRRAAETGGQSLADGLTHLLADLERGQLTHTRPGAFELGVTLATTPGKVVYETPLFQLIQYAPTTPDVLAVPLVIFPPWINRFYILDLTPAKSFVRWAVEQGLTVFMVSWRSADATMGELKWDDYVAAQVEAVDVVRDLLDVPAVHAIGYCVAGTTLAATLSVLAAQGRGDIVRTATFFTAQVDFADAGELLNFIDDAPLAMVDALSAGGTLDGRWMAAAFNLLRGRDLIWSTVEKQYLLGEQHPTFDLLHWNGDTTNLPARWHRAYLLDLYRDNKLVVPGALSVLGVPIDLRRIATPMYVQAGREDHIAPAASVWKIREHVAGPVRFLLAGSGHIAGVVNPPAAGKYGYWTNDGAPASLDDFVAGATAHRGSWWPDWIEWLRGWSDAQVPADGARIPGGGHRPAIEDAPGRYVRTR